MLKLEDFKDKIGTRYTITNGDLTESPEGEFTCSRSFAKGSIYVTDVNVSIIPINYLGYAYKLRQTDCVSLVTSWLKDNLGFDFMEYYKKLDEKKFLYYYKNGMVLYFQDHPEQFKQVHNLGDMDVGDVVVYAYDGKKVSHIGVYLGNNKILHHMPKKLSNIDEIDITKVLGVFKVI